MVHPARKQLENRIPKFQKIKYLKVIFCIRALEEGKGREGVWWVLQLFGRTTRQLTNRIFLFVRPHHLNQTWLQIHRRNFFGTWSVDSQRRRFSLRCHRFVVTGNRFHKRLKLPIIQVCHSTEIFKNRGRACTCQRVSCDIDMAVGFRVE